MKLCLVAGWLRLAASLEFPEMIGLNVPWNNFGYDIGNDAFDSTWFETYFASAETNGHNVARFWVHTDGARAGLVYNSDGTVQGLSDSYTRDLRSLLTLAQKHRIVVQLCLWSFDMCKDETSQGSTKASVVSNVAISKSYIDNALEPMLSAVSDFDNLIIETINEPEWCMKGPGNTQDIVEVADMQRFVAMIAAASHKAGRKVTTGAASLKWSSSAHEAEAFFWSDSALQSAFPSGSNVGMDFYNVHYYDWMYNDQWGYDPMRKDIAYWGLDKPTVVAELPFTSNHYTISQMLDGMTSNGFKGAMFWAYNDPSFPVTDAALQTIKSFSSSQSASYDAIINWLSFTPSPAPPVPTPPPTPSCPDEAPDSTYTCMQQKSWGKCTESWMVGWCCQTCYGCDPACGSSSLEMI